MKAFVSVLMYATNRPLGRRSLHAQKFTFITLSKIFPTSEETHIFHECAPTGGKQYGMVAKVVTHHYKLKIAKKGQFSLKNSPSSVFFVSPPVRSDSKFFPNYDLYVPLTVYTDINWSLQRFSDPPNHTHTHICALN